MYNPNSAFVPFVSERATYTITGASIVPPRKLVYVTMKVYTGNALVSLDGDPAGKFVEVDDGEGFSLPVSTHSLYIKGLGGDCEVCVVAEMEK